MLAAMPLRRRLRLELWRLSRNGRAFASYHAERFRYGRPSLTAIMNLHGSDKGTLHGYSYGFSVGHGYTFPYEQLFASRRDQPITLLEIGIGPRQPGVTGAAILGRSRRSRGSVTGWREYFPRASVHAADIVDCRHLAGERLTVHVTDQSSRDSLDSLARTIGSPLDVVIDDGSHASAHQQITLATLLPHLADDGIYVIEDLQWQPRGLDDGAPKTIGLLRMLAEAGEFPSPALTPGERSTIESCLRVLTIEEGLGRSGGAFAALAKRVA
jgi:Methyltransferase domain